MSKYILSLTAKDPQDNMVFDCSTAQEANEYKHKAEILGYKVKVRKEKRNDQS